MKLKDRIRRKIIQMLGLLPSNIRSSLVYQLSESFKNQEGIIDSKTIFDFDVLQGLSSKQEYIKTYRNCLIKAGDQESDNIYKILRHLNLYSYIEDILRRDIPGEFAECGCWNGNSLFATKYFIDKHNSTKSLHVFDSFEGGLSEFQKEDFNDGLINSLSQAESTRKQFYSSYPKLISKTDKLSRLYVNKGWIPDILTSQIERSYCFVHIDVDLYEPTLKSHQYFFDRLSEGGIIVCDDYGYRQFPGAADAVEEFIKSIPTNSYSHFIKHSIGTSVIIK